MLWCKRSFVRIKLGQNTIKVLLRRQLELWVGTRLHDNKQQTSALCGCVYLMEPIRNSSPTERIQIKPTASIQLQSKVQTPFLALQHKCHPLRRRRRAANQVTEQRGRCVEANQVQKGGKKKKRWWGGRRPLAAISAFLTWWQGVKERVSERERETEGEREREKAKWMSPINQRVNFSHLLRTTMWTFAHFSCKMTLQWTRLLLKPGSLDLPQAEDEAGNIYEGNTGGCNTFILSIKISFK